MWNEEESIFKTWDYAPHSRSFIKNRPRQGGGRKESNEKRDLSVVLAHDGPSRSLPLQQVAAMTEPHHAFAWWGFCIIRGPSRLMMREIALWLTPRCLLAHFIKPRHQFSLMAWFVLSPRFIDIVYAPGRVN